MSLMNEVLARPIEMEFLRKDSLGGERHSMGHLFIYTDCYPDRVVQFQFKDVDDPYLANMKGRGEFFIDKDGRFPVYVRLQGLSSGYNNYFDMILYPLKMDGDVGFHLHGNYGYQSVRPLTLHNVPEAINIHEQVQKLTVQDLSAKMATINMMDGGGGADDGSTVVGSSWKP